MLLAHDIASSSAKQCQNRGLLPSMFGNNSFAYTRALDKLYSCIILAVLSLSTPLAHACVHAHR